MIVFDFNPKAVDKDTPIVVWGGGTIGKFVRSYLEAEGFYDLKTIDSKKFDNEYILNPMYLTNCSKVIVIIAISGNEGFFNAMNFLEIIGLSAYTCVSILSDPKNRELYLNFDRINGIEFKYKYISAVKSYNLFSNYNCEDDDLIYGFYKRNHVNTSIDRFHTLNYCITHKCNLKCEKCGSFLPYDKDKTDDDTEEIKTSFEKLIESIEYVYDLGILGGEPFLHGDFERVVEYFAQHEKILNTHVITNGTIIPDENLLNVLYRNNVKVIISVYPQSKTGDLAKKLKDAGVICQYYKYDYWFDFYNPNQSLSEMAYEAMYELCQARSCWMIHHGRLGPCDVVTNLYYNDIIPDYTEDYIDLRDSELTSNDIRRKLETIMNKKYLNGCRFCNGGQIKCEVAKQL